MKTIVFISILLLAAIQPVAAEQLVGSITFSPQSTTPTTPTIGPITYVDSSRRPSWLTTGGFVITSDYTNITASRIFTYPNVSGTLITTGNLSSITTLGTITSVITSTTAASPGFTAVTTSTSGLGALITLDSTSNTGGAKYYIISTGVGNNGGAGHLLIFNNGTNASYLDFSPTGPATFFSSITTAAGLTAGAAAVFLGGVRTGTALVASTTTGLQEERGGVLYTLAVLTTNP